MARRRALAHAIETAGHAAIVITISATIAATALATTFNASNVATAISARTLTTVTIFAALTATALNATNDAAILAAARGASVDDPHQHELLSRPRREPAADGVRAGVAAVNGGTRRRVGAVVESRAAAMRE